MESSSYAINDYGEIFYFTVLAFPPRIAVELGVLHGYSTYHIARALRDLSGHGYLNAYDLWEDYEYNHGNMEQVSSRLSGLGVSRFVSLLKADAFSVHKDFADDSVEFLHIDISNDGDVFNKMIENWDSKLRYGAVVMFEGGSEERDKVEWMVKYSKAPIKPAIEGNKLVNTNYIYGTYQKFPSLTVLVKKK